MSGKPPRRSSDARHSFIPPHDRKLLRRILGELPELIEDLDDAAIKRTSLGLRYVTRSPSRSEPLPYDPDAVAIADQLHNSLGSWVRLVHEHRGLDYLGPVTTTAFARWLYSHLTALSFTPGAEDALADIQALKRDAEAIACPAVGILPTMNDARVIQARALYLNARGIATLARDLGEEYRNLSQRRVDVLREAGLIAPVPGPWQAGHPKQYRVGDVLDAHLKLPIRHRHAKTA